MCYSFLGLGCRRKRETRGRMSGFLSVRTPTIDGCLRNSSRRYTVAADDATVYNRTGNTAMLSHYIGYKVEITAKPTVNGIPIAREVSALG